MIKRRMDRRGFLAAGCAAVAGVWVRCAEAKEVEPPVIGAGEFRYRCVHDWGTLPETIAWGLTHGVAVDAAGNVHVLHTSRKTNAVKDTVVVFDKEGRFVRSWGETFFGTAHGFDLVVEDGREIFYITDMARGLFKTTLDGKVIWHVDRPPFYEGRKDLKYTPTNVAVSPSGDVYFADGYGSWFIHHYDKEGK